MKKVIGIGAGGHARVLIEAIRLMGGAEVVGLLDQDEALHGQVVGGVKVLGGDDLMASLKADGIEAVFNGLGTRGCLAARKSVFDLSRSSGLDVLSVTHPGAIISPSARLEAGAQVLAGAVVNADVSVGENAVINTGAIVEHDCVLGDHAFVATGAKLSGGVTLGDGAFVGVGASVLPGLQIGRNAVVGGGAVVVKAVEPDVTVVGVPARPMAS